MDLKAKLADDEFIRTEIHWFLKGLIGVPVPGNLVDRATELACPILQDQTVLGVTDLEMSATLMRCCKQAINDICTELYTLKSNIPVSEVWILATHWKDGEVFCRAFSDAARAENAYQSEVAQIGGDDTGANSHGDWIESPYRIVVDLY